MQRFGSVIGVAPGKVDEYVRLHQRVWPGVLARISASNIRNYSIFLRRLDDGQHLLFSYFEYHGADFARDMAAVAADPETQRWWQLTAPCQVPLRSRAPGEWWAAMSEVFHHD
jgi:L-rhamnose mutarotase